MPHARRRILAATLLALFGALGVTAAVMADAAFTYYNISPFLGIIQLEWGTSRETNVLRYEIYTKRQDAPETAYALHGTEQPRGGPTTAAAYWYLIGNGDLEMNTAYCFRIAVVETNEFVSEIQERCGYGFGFTPIGTITPGPFESPLPVPPAPPSARRPLTVPEPATLALFAAGLTAVAAAVRRQR